VTIRSSIDTYEPLMHNPSRGDMPRELEEAIERSTREEFEATFRRLYALRLLHAMGGIDMDDEGGDKGNKSRLLEERDIPTVLEALFTEEFYRNSPDSARRHLTRLAKQGLGRYENCLVAERDGKAVGRALVDTPNPPYAEIGLDPVHPKYAEQNEEISAELLSGGISLARRLNCQITYTMNFKNSPAAKPFYEKYGAASDRVCRMLDFRPAMLQGFDEDDKEICLFRFSDTPCYNEFLRNHPLSILSISGTRVDFHGNRAFEMRWTDPQTGDFLAFYLDGARWAMRMPRITGIARKEGPRAFDAWIHLISSDMALEGTGEYEIFLENRGEEKMSLHVSHLLPQGTKIEGQPSFPTISSVLEGKASWKLRFEIGQGFDVPPLSFYTVLATCQLQLAGFSSPFPISAGFEVKRP
jgi:hypothetical protein